MNEPIDADDAVDRTDADDVQALAVELRFRLGGSPAKVEADLYRGTAPLNAISQGLRGHADGFTDDAARRFVGDVIDAASAELENQWYTALQGSGAI